VAGSRPLSVVQPGTVGPAPGRRRRSAPRPPAYLNDRLAKRWRALWRECGDLLNPVIDAPTVERLFDLYDMLDGDHGSGTLPGASRTPLSPTTYCKVAAEARALEDRIGATPRARLTLAAAIEAARSGAAAEGGKGGQAGLDDLVDEVNG